MAHRLLKPIWRRFSSLVGHRPSGARLLRRRIVIAPPAPAPSSTADAEQRRSAEIEQEMALARDIQQGLLLEAAPRLAGWELTAISLPARDLGGDLYDFLPLGGGWHGIMIGDVSGKGLPAALRMAVARTVFRHEARRNEMPALTLAAVNRGVLSEIPHGMVTMLYARLNIAQGELRLANAGHTFPMIVNGTARELELSGLPLGVDGDSDYEEAALWLDYGDSVVLYTDGVLEAEDAQGEIYGYERLVALVEANCTLKPRAMVALLLHELRAWSGSRTQSDDITVVVLRRRLARPADELLSVAVDVLSAERAAELWAELGGIFGHTLDELSPDGWVELLPQVSRVAQARFNRGLARELSQQLRLAIEDYRSS
jgi:phosphoserine phosphatase RsbU/P